MGFCEAQHNIKAIKREVSNDLRQSEARFKQIENTVHWYESVSRIHVDFGAIERRGDRAKRDWLDGHIDRINVMYDDTAKNHQLDIKMRVPLGVPTRAPFGVIPRSAKNQEKGQPQATLHYTLVVRSPACWVPPYSDYQQFLHSTISGFRDKGWSFIKIAAWLNDSGHMTPRGAVFRSPHVHSIIKKKKLSDERFNRDPELSIMKIDLHYDT